MHGTLREHAMLPVFATLLGFARMPLSAMLLYVLSAEFLLLAMLLVLTMLRGCGFGSWYASDMSSGNCMRCKV